MTSINSSMLSYHFFFDGNRSGGHGSRRNGGREVSKRRTNSLSFRRLLEEIGDRSMDLDTVTECLVFPGVVSDRHKMASPIPTFEHRTHSSCRRPHKRKGPNRLSRMIIMQYMAPSGESNGQAMKLPVACHWRALGIMSSLEREQNQDVPHWTISDRNQIKNDILNFGLGGNRPTTSTGKKGSRNRV